MRSEICTDPKENLRNFFGKAKLNVSASFSLFWSVITCFSWLDDCKYDIFVKEICNYFSIFKKFQIDGTRSKCRYELKKKIWEMFFFVESNWTCLLVFALFWSLWLCFFTRATTKDYLGVALEMNKIFTCTCDLCQCQQAAPTRCSSPNKLFI